MENETAGSADSHRHSIVSMIRASLAILGVASVLALIGCSRSIEDELNLKYTAPPIPANLEPFYTPSENERAFELLNEGETQIDMHAYYLGAHKMGWEWAMEDETAGREHSYKSLDDVRGGLDAMRIGEDAFWIGYKSAVDQIAAAQTERNN